jgi:hypothetical protein
MTAIFKPLGTDRPRVEVDPTPPAATDAPVLDDALFEQIVQRLSRQSVEKHFDPFVDIDWDAPEMAVDATDPRWELLVPQTLRVTEWFQAQPPEKRSLMGLTIVAGLAKAGLQFENVLQRGLLEFCFNLPNDDPRYRYAMHEVIEEGHHSQMFQEFVNRAGTNPRGLTWDVRFGANLIPQLGRFFPELFLLFVLGGEEPIDYVQREGLRSDEELPPIIHRIAHIHVTEEARHLSFARSYLKLNVPRLDPVRKNILAFAAPVILGVMAQIMLKPNNSFVRRFDIPPEVVREAFDSPEHTSRSAASLVKVRKLCRDLDLLHAPARFVWQRLGIWADDT